MVSDEAQGDNLREWGLVLDHQQGSRGPMTWDTAFYREDHRNEGTWGYLDQHLDSEASCEDQVYNDKDVNQPLALQW